MEVSEVVHLEGLTKVPLWTATLAMIHDVADSQMAAAAEGERRGSLEVYCTDAQTEALAQYAQALRHAANMLTTYGYDNARISRGTAHSAHGGDGRKAPPATHGRMEDE